MKYLILALLLVAPLPDIDKIARTNALKKEAKAAYQAGNFEKAIAKYHYLLDSMNIDEDGIRINLANAYYQNGDTTGAVNNYELLRDSENRELASRAYQQLGVIKNKQKKKEEALADFKQALRKNPANEEARYNYEMLKKLLEEEKEQQEKQNQDQEKQDQEQQQDQDQQQDQNKDQKQQDQEQQQDQEGKESEQDNQDQQQKDDQQKENQEKKKKGKPDEPSDKESDNKEQQEQLNTSPDRFKDLKISEEKARMILEALKNQEVQYLQQKKRKAQKTPPSDKPDW
jgi:Ca-activated chloride channel family protein